MSSTNTTPNVTLDFSKSQPVQSDSSQQAVTLDFSKAQPTQVSMVGPQGEKQQVPAENVSAMRQKNFAVQPENPGAQKMVTPAGQVNYALPNEVDQFKQSGHTLINPDGSFDLQNIPGEDPLKEQERYQLVRKALTAQEKSGANKAELMNAAKTGAEAAIDTATGVAGVAPEVGAALNSSRLGIAAGDALGRTAGTAVRAAGAVSSSPTAKWAAKELIKGALIGTGVTTTGGIIAKILHWW